MSKTEHFDKIWSHAANQNYRDNWERTVGKKAAKKAPGLRLPKTMKSVGEYLERQKETP